MLHGGGSSAEGQSSEGGDGGIGSGSILNLITSLLGSSSGGGGGSGEADNGGGGGGSDINTDQNKNNIEIDQEYEDIGNLESVHAFEFSNSVHFIFDEGAKGESCIPEIKTSIPIIHVENVDSLNDLEKSKKKKFINDNLEDKFSQKQNWSKDDTEANENIFKRNTGGLTQAATLDKENTLFFNDLKRRIDMVLVYEAEDFSTGVLTELESLKIDYRRNFHESLIREGLELEIENKENSFDGKTCFVKIYCPYSVIEKYAAIMHLKRPVKQGKKEISFDNEGICYPLLRLFYLNSPFVIDDPTLDASVFTRSDQDKLLVKDRQGFYTSCQRSQIAWNILLRARFSDENNIGIRKLLNNGTYLSAFPLHEGKHDEDTNLGFTYDRRILYLLWARASKWYKYQPLWLIRKYFGDKIALYFAWLGFYTNMLILPSIVGLCCFIYGLSTMDSKENIPRFPTLFLELWKRKQALIAWQWDLHTLNEDDDTRPEYDLSTTLFKINPVTRQKEPFVPLLEKVIKFIFSAIVVLFMITIVLIFVIITIIIRLLMFTVISDSDNHLLKTHAKLITTVLAALINLLIIIVLNRIYHDVALWLTNKENPRTKMQYEKSFIVKIFLFEFTNYYSSFVYIAFFKRTGLCNGQRIKGRFFTHPGDSESRSSVLLKLKGDVCDPAGCLSELCIQLAIIMIGKQCFSNILELLFPAIRNWWRSRMISSKKSTLRKLTHWEDNYALQDPGNLALFEEYLEMVIQYGFVTLFVAAFPLAPLFALLNNICEIRLDAYKIVAQARRPIAERVENIGAWFNILRVLTYCSVASNAFVIAYTSDYIPRKIYQYFYSKNNTLEGYIDSSLSVFNTSHFVTNQNKLGKGFNTEPETCQYRGYRYGPNHEYAYELSGQYYLVFGARLLFVVIFEHFVFTVSEIISSLIPDVPYLVGRQIQLEKLLLEENNNRKTNFSETNMDDYDQLLKEIRCAQDTIKLDEVVQKNTWIRRISRHNFSSQAKENLVDSEN
ncbi:hypothetical protein PGB90_008803 [Kerria lacca]